MSINYYNKKSIEFFERTINLDMNIFYKPFLELIIPGGHILDAGCGSGRDSRYFINKGYTVTAMDASEEMVKIASKLINQDVLKLYFQEIDFTEKFDGIWACASLLHVNRTEICDVINKLANALKKEGILYASFGYGDKEEFDSERYFNYFDESSWDKIMENRIRLKVIKKWKVENTNPNSKDYWFHVLLKKDA